LYSIPGVPESEQDSEIYDPHPEITENPIQLRSLRTISRIIGKNETGYYPLVVTNLSDTGDSIDDDGKVECRICFNTLPDGIPDDFCRIDCEMGHIFHCYCINKWRNTKTDNGVFYTGWNMHCPLCRGGSVRNTSINTRGTGFLIQHPNGLDTDRKIKIYDKNPISKYSEVTFNLKPPEPLQEQNFDSQETQDVNRFGKNVSLKKQLNSVLKDLRFLKLK
jgi:hypothetical protein